MSDTTLIRNGTLITPGGEVQGDLLLRGGEIADVGRALPAGGAMTVVEARGCVVLPGLVDPHTHIQLDTGIYQTPDNWEIGTRTAACGGVTTVIDFATQFPGQRCGGAPCPAGRDRRPGADRLRPAHDADRAARR